MNLAGRGATRSNRVRVNNLVSILWTSRAGLPEAEDKGARRRRSIVRLSEIQMDGFINFRLTRAPELLFTSLIEFIAVTNFSIL